MGNIYSSDLTCSDKPLNIRDGTKVLFLKILLLSDEKFIFFLYKYSKFTNNVFHKMKTKMEKRMWNLIFGYR